MRAILIVAAVLLVMVALGWLSFRSNREKATLTIETQKIERDAEQAVDKGKELIREARENVRDETSETSPSSTY